MSARFSFFLLFFHYVGGFADLKKKNSRQASQQLYHRRFINVMPDGNDVNVIKVPILP